MCLLLDEPNVLVLDEPGNDLDTDMLAVLEDLLDTWPGTLLVVTHDRYLMERVTDDQFALIDGQIRHVPGGVDEYLRLLRHHEPDAAQNNAIVSRVVSQGQQDAVPEGAAETSAKAPKMSNVRRRELKKRYDAVQRKLEKLSGVPDDIRRQMGECDPTDFEGLQKLQGQLEDCEAHISEL